MEQLTFFRIFLLVIGLILHALLKLQKLKKEGKSFSLGYWISDNWMLTLATLITAFVALVLARPILNQLGADVADDAAMYDAHAFICGFLSHVLLGHLKRLPSVMYKFLIPGK